MIIFERNFEITGPIERGKRYAFGLVFIDAKLFVLTFSLLISSTRHMFEPNLQLFTLDL